MPCIDAKRQWRTLFFRRIQCFHNPDTTPVRRHVSLIERGAKLEASVINLRQEMRKPEYFIEHLGEDAKKVVLEDMSKHEAAVNKAHDGYAKLVKKFIAKYSDMTELVPDDATMEMVQNIIDVTDAEYKEFFNKDGHP